MARLTIRLSEHELHEIQRLAKLRELTPGQLGYQAFARFMEIELKNPRPVPQPAALPDMPVVAAGPVEDNLQARRGVTEPLEAVRKSGDPHFTARIEVLAALSCHDETSIFLPLASSLLTAMFLFLAAPSDRRPNTVRTVRDLLAMNTEDFLAALQRIRTPEGGLPAHAALKRYMERPFAEIDQARSFALHAVDIFFEPVLAEPAQTSAPVHRTFERSLTITVSREEHLAFVNLASRLQTSPAHLGRESIQRLVGQNRPHLALVAGDHTKD